MDRMTTDDGALSRVIAPGGLADQLLANDGLIERVLRETAWPTACWPRAACSTR